MLSQWNTDMRLWRKTQSFKKAHEGSHGSGQKGRCRAQQEQHNEQGNGQPQPAAARIPPKVSMREGRMRHSEGFLQ